jgi:hypothetical protein
MWKTVDGIKSHNGESRRLQKSCNPFTWKTGRNKLSNKYGNKHTLFTNHIKMCGKYLLAYKSDEHCGTGGGIVGDDVIRDQAAKGQITKGCSS